MDAAGGRKCMIVDSSHSFSFGYKAQLIFINNYCSAALLIQLIAFRLLGYPM